MIARSPVLPQRAERAEGAPADPDRRHGLRRVDLGLQLSGDARLGRKLLPVQVQGVADQVKLLGRLVDVLLGLETGRKKSSNYTTASFKYLNSERTSCSAFLSGAFAL